MARADNKRKVPDGTRCDLQQKIVPSQGEIRVVKNQMLETEKFGGAFWLKMVQVPESK